MRVDITSMFFNSKIINKTATPAWRTSLGQSANKECRIETDTPGVVDILVGMTYKAKSDLTILDTKGTSGDVLVCSVFDKVFVNSIKVEGKYTMLVVRETSASHSGRMQMCYSPNYSYDSYQNVDTINNMRIALGCSQQGCWFVYDISVKNQDELHFSAIVVDSNNPVEYSGESQDRSKLWKGLVDKEINQIISNLDIKEEFHRYLSEPTRFKSATTGELYWRTITSGRQEIAFLCELIKELFGYDCDDIFVITKYEEAELLWNKTKEDARNNFQNQICSAILGKYKDFLKERVPQINLPRYSNLGPLQQIFYGAPGTGKSHKVDGVCKEYKHYRTTFHPDSDYSTFVGCYKPVMRQVPTMTVIGTKSVPVEDRMGNATSKKEIEYDFIPQAFTNAYLEAWKGYENGELAFLVIEEINRGNCAQIFGDLFQLLDRNKQGFSTYPIKPDTDLGKYIESDGGLNVSGVILKGKDISEDINKGKSLVLPPNLYIWATMNTSDQSLFPIDSAFKRRWDWKYTPISDAGKGYHIDVNGKSYDWWSFLEKVNEIVEEMTSSEDKQLGYFFCKADGKKISAEKFVGKVIFYLWNDVFKDYGFDRDEFKYQDGEVTKAMTFRKFFNADGSINETMAEQFLTNLKLTAITISDKAISQEEEKA